MTEKPVISFDYAIKLLLKDKSSYDLIEGFISTLLASGGYGPVKITALLDGESNKERPSLKKSIADLIVEDTQKQKYIVEIEREYVDNFMYKACFNTSRLIVDSIEAGQDYDQIKKVFHITLLYFTWGNMTKPLYHSKIITREIDSEHPINLHISDQGGIIHRLDHIFPEYFFISIPLFDDTVIKEMDEWLYVLKHSSVRDDFKSPYMKKLAERLSIVTMNAEEQDAYYRFLKENLTKRDQFNAAVAKGKAEGKKEGREEGKKEGKKEGRAEGKKEGRAEGKKEGRAEGKKEGRAEGIKARNIEIANNMLLELHLGIDVVQKATGLSKAELEELIQEASK